MRYTIEMASLDMMYIPSVLKICIGIQAVLSLCLRNWKRLQCWYYWCEGFMMYTIEMPSCGMLFLMKFHEY
jgi:hypothetical protein